MPKYMAYVRVSEEIYHIDAEGGPFIMVVHNKMHGWFFLATTFYFCVKPNFLFLVKSKNALKGYLKEGTRNC